MMADRCECHSVRNATLFRAAQTRLPVAGTALRGPRTHRYGNETADISSL
jgi:hypothetical protein